MSSATRGKAWASEEDWQKHRDVITHLWWEDDKPLKEVQTIMAQEHDFHASDKMYKGRLKAWGLLKNLKSKDADQIMGLSGIATSPLIIGGRPMASKKWQKRLNRITAPEELTGTAMRPVRVLTKDKPPTMSTSGQLPSLRQSGPTIPDVQARFIGSERRLLSNPNGLTATGQQAASLKRTISEDLSSENESHKKKLSCLAQRPHVEVDRFPVTTPKSRYPPAFATVQTSRRRLDSRLL